MDWCGLVEAAKALREDGRLDEAEGDLAKAISEFRDIESILADYGWAAQRERKWAEAVPRWELYRRRFPSHFLGYALGCAALRESGRLDEADSVAAEGLRLFPDHPEVVANFAWVANRRGDWHEALRRWQMYAAAFPDDPLGYVFAGNTLREMRLYEQADCVLRQGLKDHPTHPELLSRYASVAYDRQDWPEALRRWTDFRDRHPDLPWGHQQVAAVLGGMGRFAEADDQSRTARAHLADPTLAQLVLRFEGLGDNCEFGLVQRHFGAEPLGLLRWTGITPAHLANALESGFAGVGTEDQTGLDLAGNEYVTEDRRFGMRMHTFIPGSLSDRDHIFAQQPADSVSQGQDPSRPGVGGEDLFVQA